MEQDMSKKLLASVRGGFDENWNLLDVLPYSSILEEDQLELIVDVGGNDYNDARGHNSYNDIVEQLALKYDIGFEEFYKAFTSITPAPNRLGWVRVNTDLETSCYPKEIRIDYYVNML
jgi:hypothetical protein